MRSGFSEYQQDTRSTSNGDYRGSRAGDSSAHRKRESFRNESRKQRRYKPLNSEYEGSRNEDPQQTRSADSFERHIRFNEVSDTGSSIADREKNGYSPTPPASPLPKPQKKKKTQAVRLEDSTEWKCHVEQIKK